MLVENGRGIMGHGTIKVWTRRVIKYGVFKNRFNKMKKKKKFAHNGKIACERYSYIILQIKEKKSGKPYCSATNELLIQK